MKKHASMLKSARLQKNWTAQYVSKQVGVSLNTYNRWEAGSQVPRLASLDALCKIFAMSPEELGFADLSSSRKNREHLLVDEEDHVPAFDAEEQSAQVEALALLSLDITSCWQLYMAGNQSELERMLPDFLSNLSKPTLYPNPEQRVAARLTAQVYQLLALLELQRGDFVAAQRDGTQALIYSQLSRDGNLYIASQIRLAAIFTARKRIGSALNAYNEALRHVTEARDEISPMLHSWIFAGLAEIQATMGREKEALQLLQLAFAVFPERPEDDLCFAYARCDRSMLYLYEGLVFLRLGQPRTAWNAFAQVDELAPPERVRAEFLQQKAYTSCVLGNMIQSCIYLEAAAKAAQGIESDLALSEVYTLYEHMLALWGQEPRVKALSRLFQK
jgi:transcriptional regulator with XRE-family HTH domain